MIEKSSKTGLKREAQNSPDQGTRRRSLRVGLKEFTRQRILEGALQCFQAHGYRAATLEQIVEIAGTTVPTFYRHFPSKADLLRPLNDHLEAEVEATLSELDKVDISSMRAVRQWFDSYMTMWVRVHRLCQAHWEATHLDRSYAENVLPATFDTMSVMKNVLGRVRGAARRRLELRLALLILFMDRVAELVSVERSSARSSQLIDEFCKILWVVLNNAPALDAEKADWIK